MTETDEIQLPADPAELSPQWLSRALSQQLPGTHVASVEVLEVRHGTNSNARLQVHYEDPSELPESFFLKLPPLDPARREMVNRTGMGRREALFYQTLAKRVPMRVPRPFFAGYDESSGAFALLLEDLEQTSCTIPDAATGLDFDQAKGVMLDFAALHARYQDDAIRRREADWITRLARGSDFGTSMLQVGLDRHRDRLTDAFAELAELYIVRQSDFEELWDQGATTVLHGDGHIGNLFLDGARVGFLDWGMMHLGNPLRDVGFFLVMALSPETRRKHEAELIRHYLAARQGAGGSAISFDEAWRLYRLHGAYAVPASCSIVLFPRRRSPEDARLAEAFLARAECAIEDLDCRNALREFAGF